MRLIKWCLAVVVAASCVPKKLEVQKPIRVEEGERKLTENQTFSLL